MEGEDEEGDEGLRERGKVGGGGFGKGGVRG